MIKKINWLFCFTFFQIVTIIILLISILSSTQAYHLPMQICSIMTCIISYVALFMLYRQIIKKAELEADNEILKKQIMLQKEHSTALKENQKQLEEIKVEILDKMNVENPEHFKDEDSTRSYINMLIAKSNKLSDLEFCQNKVIDAILYNKFLIAKSLQIKTSAEVIYPEILNIDALDLMRLLTNLMDNAIDACKQVEEEKRFIQIKGQLKAGLFVLKIVNSKTVEQEVDYEHPVSTKHNAKEHGLGINIIKSVIDRYQGSYSIDDKTNSVDINITLQCDSAGASL